MLKIWVGITIVAFSYFVFAQKRLVRLFSVLASARRTNIRLDFAPSAKDTFGLLLAVALKYCPGFRPPKLAKFYNSRKEAFIFPQITIEAPLMIDSDALAKFQRATGDSTNENNPPFLLPALASPYMVHLFAHRACPLMPLGAVNVSNRFEWSGSNYGIGKAYRIVATFGGDDDNMLGRRVKRGIEASVIIKVLDENNHQILQQTMRVLAFLPAEQLSLSISSTNVQSYAVSQVAETQTVSATAKDTLTYANLVGDYNPIHVHPLLGKAFGQRGQIAHGNLMVAKTLQAIDFQTNGKSTIDVRFMRPMVLPCKLQVRQDKVSGNFQVSNAKDGKVHMEGCVQNSTE